MAERNVLNQKNIMKIGIVLILGFTLISLNTWQKKRQVQVSLTEALGGASSEIELGQTQVIVVRNPFKAEVCLICQGYADENYIYSKTKQSGISKIVAARVASKIPPYDGTYLVLLKNGIVVCVAGFPSCVKSTFQLSETGSLGKPILVAEIDGQIEITLKKVVEGQPLLIVQLE
jgi:hypothetical protein